MTFNKYIMKNNKGQFYNFMMERFEDKIEQEYLSNYIRDKREVERHIEYIKSSSEGKTRSVKWWIRNHKKLVEDGLIILSVEVSINYK